jgi:hypothetical protein
MAIKLLTGGTANLDFGDIDEIGGIQSITVAFNLKTTNDFGGDRMTGQWGVGAGSRSFIVLRSGNEIYFIVTENGILASLAFGEMTTTSPIAFNTLHRIMVTWIFNPKGMVIWVDGVQQSTTNIYNGSPSKLNSVSGPVYIGYGIAESAVNVNGDYSEYAIWDHKVPDWVAEAYGKGATPNIYRNGGIVYTKAVNTSYLFDEWGGFAITNTNGTTSEHPGMFYQPSRPAIALAPAPPEVSFGKRSVIVENGASVLSAMT